MIPIDEVNIILDEWEDEAKETLCMSGDTKNEEIAIKEEVKDKHEDEIKTLIDEANQEIAEIQVDFGEYTTEEEIDEAEAKEAKLEELKDRLYGYL